MSTNRRRAASVHGYSWLQPDCYAYFFIVDGVALPDPMNTFAWIGSFSAGGMMEDFDASFPALDSRVNGQLRLLWIACGTEDGLIGANRKFGEWLTSKGVKFTVTETPGAHTWMVWRRNLAAFAPLLFR